MDHVPPDHFAITSPARPVLRVTADGKLRGSAVTRAIITMSVLGFGSGVAGALAVELLLR